MLRDHVYAFGPSFISLAALLSKPSVFSTASYLNLEMAIQLYLFALTVSTVFAAPQNLLEQKQQPADASTIATPTSFVPPPLNIKIGGVRTLVPVVNLLGGDSEQRNAPVPRPLAIPVADARPVVPVIPEVEQRDLPQPPVITEVAQPDAETPPAPSANRLRRPPKKFVPPPLTLVVGGYHTLEPVLAHAKRDAPEQTATPTFATFYPTSDASATPITEQGQLVTTYSPTTQCDAGPSPTDGAEPSCTVSLVPGVTPVCATTLEPLGAEPIPITKCDQYVTYSSQHGYELAAAQPTADAAAPPAVQEIHTFTTYYAAVWTDVMPGVKPTAGIEVVCSGTNDCTTKTSPSPAASTTPATEVDQTELRV